MLFSYFLEMIQVTPHDSDAQKKKKNKKKKMKAKPFNRISSLYYDAMFSCFFFLQNYLIKYL